MAAGFSYNTELYDIYYVVQNTMLRYPKDLIIASLKDFFGQDSKYHFVSDSWGYSKTVDLTDVPADAGLYDELTTRVFIGENNRYDIIQYPAILVKAGSFRYVPISLNRNLYYVENNITEFTDGYQRRFLPTPDKFVMAGAWEGSLNIEIQSRAVQEADDLAELVAIYLVDINWSNLSRAGVSIKPDVSIGAATETEDRNDKLHHRIITINIRGEWRREIPISNFVELITFCVEFGDTTTDNYAPNIEVHTELELENVVFTEEQVGE
jgi:hypothetical protein